VEKLLTLRGNSFESDVIARVSRAAAPLAAWVRANMRFSEVLIKIAPLENQLASLTSDLSTAKGRLDENERELAVLDRKVKLLLFKVLPLIFRLPLLLPFAYSRFL
jgi:dynein heavy chain 2, cytosolic